MCGIAGVVQGKDAVDLERVAWAMTDALAHRGPDGRGVHVFPGRLGAFAHTRLAVIDPGERSAQPFVSEDGQAALVFNGEIYNFRELRASLERGGARFRTGSDTEVILEQYRARGVRGLDALDGMFALAIWDATESKLILARDRLGKKPLHYAFTAGGSLVFSSEIEPMAAHPGVSLAPDPRRIPELLTFGYVGTPRTCYAGVHRLPPATRLVLAPGRPPEIARYWSIDGVRPEAMSPEEAVDRVRRAIGDAVARRMNADVPLGAFLSGGVDSSVVVAEMAARSTGRVRTFAVGFTGDASYDETPFAREVARRFDTDHTEIRVCAAPHLMEKLLRHHGEPYGDSSALAVYAVAEETRRHVTVALTGDGGDELFAGYTRFLGGLAAGRVPKRLARLAGRALARVPTPRGYKHPVALLSRFVEHPDRSWSEQLLAFNAYFAGGALAGILRPELRVDPWDVMSPQARRLSESHGDPRDRLDAILRHNLETYLLDDLLAKLDRATMAVALEARCPFLDTSLVEIAFRMPSSIKLRRGRLKWILKEAYREVLPPAVLRRRKHGFGVPVGRWWNGEARGLVDDLLLAPNPRLAEYLRAETVRALIGEHRRGTRDHGQRIFLLLVLELWLRGRSRH